VLALLPSADGPLAYIACNCWLTSALIMPCWLPSSSRRALFQCCHICHAIIISLFISSVIHHLPICEFSNTRSVLPVNLSIVCPPACYASPVMPVPKLLQICHWFFILGLSCCQFHSPWMISCMFVTCSQLSSFAKAPSQLDMALGSVHHIIDDTLGIDPLFLISIFSY